MYKTDQEVFWAGEFGDEYIGRNKDQKLLASNISLFSKILSKTDDVNSVIEFGANVGMNLKAIMTLLPNADMSGIEINQRAAEELARNKDIEVYCKTIFDFEPDRLRDLVLIKGVLIHINPEMLDKAYDLLYKTSKKYICIAEYYNPAPVSINYRGHSDRLFKRDFAGEMLDKYPDLKLVDYGFGYHRDNNFPQDDINWFLLEKSV